MQKEKKRSAEQTGYIEAILKKAFSEDFEPKPDVPLVPCRREDTEANILAVDQEEIEDIVKKIKEKIK